MTAAQLSGKLREIVAEDLPAPAGGNTAARHQRLFQVAQQDVSLAKLAEAHWDAVAILKEAVREPAPGAIYAVWASESLEHKLHWFNGRLSGSKRFCSGLGLVDRALVTVAEPQGTLLDVDLAANRSAMSVDLSGWASLAFAETHTGTLVLSHAEVPLSCVIGTEDWYVTRPGFWHGACSSAACWAGGAAGLMHYVQRNRRQDPHTLAHIGAIAAEITGMQAVLAVAAAAMDASPLDRDDACTRALTVRHLVEAGCSRVLEHFGRAFGPHPIAMDAEISRRVAEVQLFIRQSHAERDLQQLGERVMSSLLSS